MEGCFRWSLTPNCSPFCPRSHALQRVSAAPPTSPRCPSVEYSLSLWCDVLITKFWCGFLQKACEVLVYVDASVRPRPLLMNLIVTGHGGIMPILSSARPKCAAGIYEAQYSSSECSGTWCPGPASTAGVLAVQPASAAAVSEDRSPCPPGASMRCPYCTLL